MRRVTLGVGCDRGTAPETLRAAVMQVSNLEEVRALLDAYLAGPPCAGVQS